jgi:dTDP-4-dehydrorhamnose 3,5-epimerase
LIGIELSNAIRPMWYGNVQKSKFESLNKIVSYAGIKRMIFSKLTLPGCFQICMEGRGDDRGFFERTYCQREFVKHGLIPDIAQINISMTQSRGSLRGLHFQRSPHAEDKTIRCLRGRVFDVVVDLRAGSLTYGQCQYVILDSEERSMIYIPKGCAHGFQTLTEDVEMLYLHSEFYCPSSEGGLRYDSPDLGIDWPLPVSELSDRDRGLPIFDQAFEGIQL